MNARGREVLRAAALRGQRQAFDAWQDPEGGRCAIIELAVQAAARRARYDVVTHEEMTVEYGLTGRAVCCGVDLSEISLVRHLNDQHRLDFLGIAAKMPESPEEGGA